MKSLTSLLLFAFCFSSSSLRFGDNTRELVGNPAVGDTLGVATWGSCSYQSGTPDFFFYGIHGIEALFTIMGSGCETVARTKGPQNDQVTGVWKDGRIGTYRGIVQGKAESGAVVFGSKAVLQSNKKSSYEPLCREIAKFFRTGVAPVSPEETIEIFAFMEAADQSKRQDGKPVSLNTALSLLSPSDRDVAHGLALHANSIVFESYGFAPRCAVDGDAIQKALDANRSDLELADLRVEMMLIRAADNEVERREFLEAFHAAGVTSIFQNAGEEGNNSLGELVATLRFSRIDNSRRKFVMDQLASLYRWHGSTRSFRRSNSKSTWREHAPRFSQ